MAKKRAWNKGKIVGPKTALTPEQVQTIPVILAEQGRLRDQLLFALAIDSCLRGCDLLQLRVCDLMLAGEVRDRVRVQPSKTRDSSGVAVVFDLSPDTAKLLRSYIEVADLISTDLLFTATRGKSTGKPLTERTYANLVKQWVGSVRLNPDLYGTHSLRRSRPAYLYKKTGQLRACQIMLGHSSIISTQRYLGIEETETLELAAQYRL